jgi:hypothetical protein
LILILTACGRDKQWDLSEAAARGDLAEVKRLFEAGVDLDAYPQMEGTGGGSPALHEAASAGHDDVVRFFLQHNANLEMTFSDTGTPLAAALRHPSTAKLLLDHGASANHALRGILDPRSHRPPLDKRVYDLLEQHGAITKVVFKRIPVTSFLCTGAVLGESEIPEFLDAKVPELFAAIRSVDAAPSGPLQVNYTGRNLRSPERFYVEIAVPFDNDKHRVPAGFYFRTATEFKCFAGATSGSWTNIRCGAAIIEAKLWSEGKAYPTFDMREVYQVWKSAGSADNVVEIQFGIHRPARDAQGNRYQEPDNLIYEGNE